MQGYFIWFTVSSKNIFSITFSNIKLVNSDDLVI